MEQVDTGTAGKQISKLVDRARDGETIALTRRGKVVAFITADLAQERGLAEAEVLLADRRVTAASEAVKEGTTTTERVFGAEAALGAAPPGGWPAPIPPLDAVADPAKPGRATVARQAKKPDPLDGNTAVRRPGEYSAAELDAINRERLARTGKKK